MTIAMILSAHGSVSEHLLKTTEMIIGKQKNVAWTNLLPEENADKLIEKYNTHLSTLNISSGILFLVDIWGGSPFNAANNIMLNQKNCDIVTGINVPMLIEIFMARDSIHSINKLVEIAIISGNDSIKSVKYTSSNNNHPSIKTKKIQNVHSNKSDISLSSENILKLNDENHMNISLARIDDRLIHGQVVTRWAKEYNIKRIIVVNDEISHDTIRKTLLTQVTPPGITAHVLDIEKTVRVFQNPKYAGDKVMMLFTNPTDVLRLVNKGIPIHSVNIGGMAFCQGKTQIDTAISVSITDIEAFKILNDREIKLEIRKVPSDPSINIMKLIQNIKI